MGGVRLDRRAGRPARRRRGFFRECDPWEVADILWTLANGLIQTQTSPAHRRLRKRSLDLTFEDAVEIVIRGLTP